MVERPERLKELAAWSGWPASWIYAQAEAGRIPHLKVGKYLLFYRSEVKAWLEAQRRGPRPAPAPNGAQPRRHGA